MQQRERERENIERRHKCYSAPVNSLHSRTRCRSSVCFKHELMPIPVSLAAMNDTLLTGNKLIMADCLTDGVPCPEQIIILTQANLILDGQALVMSIGKPDGATTFSDLADTFCNSVFGMVRVYQRIDVVFDRYTQSSIRDGTRNRRTKGYTPIRRLIEERDVPLPQNWGTFWHYKTISRI